MRRAIATLPLPINGAVIAINECEALIMWVEEDTFYGQLAITNSTMSSRGLRCPGILYAFPGEAFEVAQKEHLLVKPSFSRQTTFCLFHPHSADEYKVPPRLDLDDGQKLEVHYLETYQGQFLVHLAIA